MIKIRDKKKFVIFLVLLVCLVASGFYMIKKISEYSNINEDSESISEDLFYDEGVERLSAGDFDEASRILEDSLSENSNNPQKMKMLAFSYYNQKNYEEAKKIFGELLEMDSENDYIYYNSLANIHRDQENYEEAIEYYEKAIEANLEYETAYVNLVVFYEVEVRDLGKAQEVVVKGLENIPDSDILLNKKK